MHLIIMDYGQSCFVGSDFLKMKFVWKTQMMPPPNHQNPVDKPCIYIRMDERTDRE